MEGGAKEVITDKSIADIAGLVENWENLAHEMQPLLTEPEIIEIKNDYSYYKEKKSAYLRAWREKLGNRATYQCLIASARASGRENLASSISNLIGIAVAIKKESWGCANQIPLPSNCCFNTRD